MIEMSDDEFERALGRRVIDTAGACPDDESLLMYSRGEIPPAEQGDIMCHVGLCGRCKSLLQDEERIANEVREVAILASEELAHIPSTLDRKIRAFGEREKVSWYRRSVQLPAWGALAAATLLLVLISHAGWRQVREGESVSGASGSDVRPTGDCEILVLFGDVRAKEDIPIVDATDRLVVIQLGTLEDLTKYTDIEARFIDAAGRTMWTIERLRPARTQGGFVIAVPGASLPTGQITIQVYGKGTSTSESLHEEYTFRVVRELNR